MFVTSIEYGAPSADCTKLSPSWDFVEKTLRSLDGDGRDGAILSSPGQTYLGISGGRNDQYIVAGYVEGRGSVILSNGPKQGEPQQVVVCGDFNTYAPEFVVGLEDVIVAAKTFHESGDLAQQFRWEKQA